MSDKQKFFLVFCIFVGLVLAANWYYLMHTERPNEIILTAPDGTTPLGFGPSPALSYPNFFNTTKERLVASGETFIEANLSEMILRVHEDGAVILEIPIKTKGREGSWWETPAGLYKVETKEENHFSSIGSVYQPWSLSFQGNFFIHGWPYYPDGEAVSSTFSGGCIRLADENAKALFDLVSVGTPVLVYEEDFFSDGFSYELPLPDVSADAYIVADLKSYEPLLQKNTNESLPVASLTKLLTALTAAEYINMDKDITIDPAMLATTSIPRLGGFTSVKGFHLLYPLLLESSNEAAEALAQSMDRAYFISLMNKKATSLGMEATVVADPSGVEGANVSTVHDLFALTRYIFHNRSFVWSISAGKASDATYGPAPFLGLVNLNNGANDPSFRGGKVGKSTSAKETAISIFDITHQGVSRPLVFIVLGSEDSARDITTLRQYVGTVYGAW